MELPFIVSILALLICALLVVTALNILRLPTVPAYFIAGLLAGPHGWDVLGSGDDVHFAAELGVVLLLFTIGLKFNLGILKSMRNTVFFLGGSQVLFTMLAVTPLAYFLLDDFAIAVLIGGITAMSSTAIASQILIEEGNTASPIGRRVMGVLLFQDLAVIPLIIVYSGDISADALRTAALLLAVKIALVLAFVTVVGAPMMRGWLNWVARFGDKDLFVLHIVVIIILAAATTRFFGLSLELGAFLAGILIAETLHRQRVEQMIEPFRQLFLGFFFMTLGALINPREILDNAALILLLTAAFCVIKFPIVYACVRLNKTHRLSAFKVTMLLGGGGEFGFVLLAVANNSGALSDGLFQLLVPVNILTLILTPFLWERSDAWVTRLFKDDWLTTSGKMAHNVRSAGGAAARKDHVIVCGFGRTGQAVAGILRAAGTDFIALENDHALLSAVGESSEVIYGDADRKESLIAAGILRAKVLIIAHGNETTAAFTAQLARRMQRDLYIIGKASTTIKAEELKAAGADEALIDAHEAGLSLAAQCLRNTSRAPAASGAIEDIFMRARDRSDPMFQSEFSGTGQAVESADYLDTSRFSGYIVPDEFAGGDLRELTAGADVAMWRSAEKEVKTLENGDALAAGDELVLSGTPEVLQKIREQFAARAPAAES